MSIGDTGSERHFTEARKMLENLEVTSADIRRTLPPVGGSKIIIQRHERYQREDIEGDVPIGILTRESAQKAYDQTREILKEMLASIPKEEWDGVSFLVVGSNTQFKGKGMRSMETAAQILQALRDEMRVEDSDEGRIQNNRSRQKGVAPITKMQAPRFLDASKEYLAFLQEKYGDETLAFWKAFEEDTHKEDRMVFGAEGPEEIDKRFTAYLKALKNYADDFHQKNPSRRLVIWAVSHYDTISPFIKRHITQTDPHQFLDVDYGAGISIEIDPKGQATSTFQNKEYPVNLNR